MQNGELNPCLRQEKLKEVLLGHQPYRMAKALWDHSMVEKHEASEHARLVVVQDPRDTVKAGLPEPQSPGMEVHIHRHGMYGRCPWNRTVSLSSSELFLQGTTVSEIVQGDEQDTYVALGRSTRTDTGSPKSREAYGDGVVIVVRGRESRPHGEGPQVSDDRSIEVAAMARAENIRVISIKDSGDGVASRRQFLQVFPIQPARRLVCVKEHGALGIDAEGKLLVGGIGDTGPAQILSYASRVAPPVR